MENEISIREEIQYKINNISKLSTLPAGAQSILDLVNSPKSNAADLEKVINTDQVLTSRILKTANSAYYGFQKEVATLKLAVVILGFDTIKGLALSCSIIENIKLDDGLKQFDLRSFWEHSISTAVIAQAISKSLGHNVSGEAFVAGLLHDIGMLILAEEFPDLLVSVIEEIKENNTELRLAEIKHLGCTHHEIGFWLMTKWNFPESLKNVILHHHEFLTMEKFQLAKTIEVADKLSCYNGYKGPISKEVTEAEIVSLLTPKEYSKVVPLSTEAIEKSVHLFQSLLPSESL